MLDIRQLIGEVASRHGIRVEPDDPAFALVTLNQLVLEETARLLNEEIRTSISEFERATHRVETRAGKLIAERVREAASQFSSELEANVSTAGLKATELVNRVHEAHSRAAQVRWIVVGLLAGIGLFAAGVWIGAHFIR